MAVGHAFGHPFGAQALPLVITDPLAYLGTDLQADWDWYSASFLYTDSARTTLVTSDSDPVGSVSDISTYGRHLAQGTAGARHLWRQSLYGAGAGKFDKVDDRSANTSFTWLSGWEVFISLRITRTTFPGPVTFDVALTSGLGGTNNYDKDTYNGSSSTTNNRAAQRRANHLYLSTTTSPTPVPVSSGVSLGTAGIDVIMSGRVDGTATSNIGWFLGAHSDLTNFGNQAMKRILVVGRNCSDAEVVAFHHYLQTRWL